MTCNGINTLCNYYFTKITALSTPWVALTLAVLHNRKCKLVHEAGSGNGYTYPDCWLWHNRQL